MAGKLRISPEVQSLINTLLPLTVAGIVGYTAYRKKVRWEAIVLLALASGVFLRIIMGTVFNAVNTIADKPAPVEVPQGTLPANFDGKVWADRLHKDIYSGLFTARDHDLYRLLAEMNNGQLAAIGNAWSTYHFGKDKETLSKAISGEWFDWLYPNETVTYAKTIIQRLQSMGL